MAAKPIELRKEEVRKLLKENISKIKRPISEDCGYYRMYSHLLGSSLSTAQNIQASPTKELCPFGKCGDLLWVQEDFGYRDWFDSLMGTTPIYLEDYDKIKIKHPAKLMSRFASRITLEIFHVSVDENDKNWIIYLKLIRL